MTDATRRVRGALHVHSTISYDGQRSIDELARFFRARGLDFVCMSEHSDGLTQAAMQGIVDGCAAASSDDLLLVPGVEFSCRRRLHILGLGVTVPIESDDPIVVAQHVRAHGGVCIVAHPLSYGTDYPDDMARHVDGLEVWNITKDGWFAPGARHLRLWESWRRVNPQLRGYGALDLHDIDSPAGLHVEIDVQALTVANVLDGLRHGAVEMHGRYLRIDGKAPPTGIGRQGYLLASGVYTGMRRWRDRAMRGRS